MSKSASPSAVVEQFNAAKVKELLEKTKHYDADERFMSTKDLMDQLRLVSGALDVPLQQPVRDAILRLLDDKNSDVSTMAVKCLSQLCQKFANEQIVYIVDKLADIIVDPSKAASRDVVTDGLQTMIASMAEEAGAHIAPKLIVSLLRGITKAPGEEIDCEMAALTVIKNLLVRFGSDVSDQHLALKDALTNLLQHPNDSVRKRASITLGPLVTVLDDALFAQLMEALIVRLESSNTPGTYIQSISAICKSAGVKVGPYLPKIVPRLEKFCLSNASSSSKKRDDDEEDAAQLELWEQSLQALEAITRRCPNKVTPYVPNIVRLATSLSTYDPLYTYEDDVAMEGGAKKATAKSRAKAAAEDAWGADDDGGDAWGDEDGDAAMAGGGGDGWDDDEAAASAVATASSDNSWKVRRAAVGLLTAFIQARSDILKSYYNDICDHLVGRFKERDSAVKENILMCTRELLRESVVTGKAGAQASDAEMTDDAPPAASFLRTRSSYETLDIKLPQIVHACERLFKAPLDSRTQQAIFALLAELVRVRHGGLDEYLENLMPHILNNIASSAKTKEAEASGDALKLLHSILDLHKFDVLQPYLASMAKVLCDTVAGGIEQLKAEALSVIAAVSKLTAGKGQKAITESLYKVVYSEFVQKDVPLNIKLAAIVTLASVLSYNGEADLDRAAVSAQVMPVLLERLANDSTVQPTLKGLTRIANLSDSLDFGPLIAHSGEVIQLCRKSTHHIKNDTVRCMEALIRRSAASKLKRPAASTFSEQQLTVILNEVAGLLSDNDLHLAHLVLDLSSTTLTVGSAAAQELIPKSILPQAIKLMISPRLQGVALSSLIRFLQACVASAKSAALQYSNLLSMLLQQVSSQAGQKLNKSTYLAIAQCVAGTTEKASDKQANETVSKFVSEIVNAKELDEHSQIALLVLGEMGRRRDLTAHAGLEAACLKAFDAKDEMVRASAAFALGNISVGNLSKNLPTLLGLIKQKLSQSSASTSHHGYLLFSALKEIILSYSNDIASLTEFRAYTDAILPLLLANVGHPHEATRAMVAECLGRLIVVDPAKLMFPLEKLVSAPQGEVRACVITSVRFSLHPLMAYEYLYQNLPSFLTPLLKDADLEARRQTLLSINAIARVNIEAVPRDTLYAVILPTLYFETKVKPELVKEVDYGAFKKIIDDGKPLRRAAYQTLQTLLEVTPHRIDLPEYIAAVKQGIHDDEDLQMLTYQIFIELAKFHGSALLEIIDQLPKLIMDSVKKYISEAKSKEPETALEVLRSIVRALLVFNQIPGVELCTQYSHFFRQVQATSLMATLIKEAQGSA